MWWWLCARGGGAREACEACEAGVSYCCAMVSTSLGGAEQRKERMGALCAVNLWAVFRDSASVECLSLGAAVWVESCGLVSVGRSLDWESRKRIPGDVKGCRRAKTKARPGWP